MVSAQKSFPTFTAAMQANAPALASAVSRAGLSGTFSNPNLAVTVFTPTNKVRYTGNAGSLVPCPRNMCLCSTLSTRLWVHKPLLNHHLIAFCHPVDSCY